MTKLTYDEIYQKIKIRHSEQPIMFEGTKFKHKSGRMAIITGHSIDCDTNEMIIHYKMQENPGSIYYPDWSFSRPERDFFGNDEDGNPRFTRVYPYHLDLTREERQFLDSQGIAPYEKDYLE